VTCWPKLTTTYGEATLDQFAEDVDTAIGTIRALRAVAMAYPNEISRRSRNSWSVYQVLASQDDRDQLLARPDPWTVKEARELVRERKQPAGLTADDYPGPSVRVGVTPRDRFYQWNKRYGPFTLDVAASPENTKVPSAFYTREENGLSQPWPGVAWCNAPFSDLSLWVR
jgi:hypothetical protein